MKPGRPSSSYAQPYLRVASRDTRWHLFLMDSTKADRVARKLRRDFSADAHVMCLDEENSVLAVRTRA